jgi:hypothetical protein
VAVSISVKWIYSRHRQVLRSVSHFPSTLVTSFALAFQTLSPRHLRFADVNLHLSKTPPVFDSQRCDTCYYTRASTGDSILYQWPASRLSLVDMA